MFASWNVQPILDLLRKAAMSQSLTNRPTCATKVTASTKESPMNEPQGQDDVILSGLCRTRHRYAYRMRLGNAKRCPLPVAGIGNSK